MVLLADIWDIQIILIIIIMGLWVDLVVILKVGMLNVCKSVSNNILNDRKIY